MCFGGKGGGDSSRKEPLDPYEQILDDAKRAREEEEERQARITEGVERIDGIFDQFGDDYYSDRRSAYEGYYLPQIEDQYSDAQDNVTYALARSGTLKSTMAGDKMADLLKDYNDQRAAVASNANADVQNAKSRIARQRSNLIQQLNSTGDASRTANEALSQATQLYEEQPEYNPIGDIFAGAASGIGGYVKNNQNQQLLDAYYGPRATGSARTVR